jgi:hypothetical protein
VKIRGLILPKTQLRPLGYISSYNSTAPGHYIGPRGIEINIAGRIYVIDVGNHRIDMLEEQPHFIREDRDCLCYETMI